MLRLSFILAAAAAVAAVDVAAAAAAAVAAVAVEAAVESEAGLSHHVHVKSGFKSQSFFEGGSKKGEGREKYNEGFDNLLGHIHHILLSLSFYRHNITNQ